MALRLSVPRRAARLFTGCTVLAALALGGCSSRSEAPRADAARGPAIAFDSIDGPPRPVFDRLVANLDSAARARGLPVVTREGDAAYRVRGYLAATRRGDKTTIAWVWDVYDPAQRRRLRVAGEEPVRARGGDLWATADEAVLRKVAQEGVQAFAMLLALPAAPAPEASPGSGGERTPTTPRRSGPAVAEREETGQERVTTFSVAQAGR